MNRFYGDVTGQLPAVMTDDSFSVLFANRAAYHFAPVHSWLNSGKVSFPPACEAEVRKTVLPDAGSVSVSLRISNRRYHLLCRRMVAGTLSVYLFAFVRGGELPEEASLASPLSGMRMLSACFAPRHEREYYHPCQPLGFLRQWFSGVSDEVGRAVFTMKNEFPEDAVFLPDEALASVLTALLSVADGYAEGEIAVSAEPRKGGFAVRFFFSAPLGVVLTEAEDPALLCAAFHNRLPQMVCAVHTARQSGFSLTASTLDRGVELLLACHTYDLGDLGFKANRPDSGNFPICLLSSRHLLF